MTSLIFPLEVFHCAEASFVTRSFFFVSEISAGNRWVIRRGSWFFEENSWMGAGVWLFRPGEV